MMYKACCLVVVFVLIIGCEKQPEQGVAAGEKRPKQKTTPIEAKKWKTVGSSEGRFQVDLPQDWTIRDRQEENPAVATPEDKEVPEIAITGGLDATVANYFLTGNFDIVMSTIFGTKNEVRKV